MELKIRYAFAFLLACNIVQAQEEVFIYNGNDKEYFEVNKSVKYVKYCGKHNRNTENLFDMFQTNEQVMPDVFKITLNNSNRDLFDRKITEIDSIYVADELIYKGDGTKQCCFNHILLQTKNSINLAEILDNYHIPYISFEKFGVCENEYLVKLSVSAALYYSNKLFETGHFVYAQPSFYRFNIFQNPMYPQQWGLKNTGQHSGTLGMDINVEPAWEIATGEGIKVAVIDCGIQLDHPDLQNNLLPGFDATGGGSSGSYVGTDYHGTCCAGIIAACDNNIGIKGIAYNSKIIPIKCSSDGTYYDIYIINAFNYSYNNNADIISCSWGGGSESTMVTNAINYVVENGRNGLGVPVLFAVGNQNYPSINYPSSIPSTIAVGAMNPCGERISPTSCGSETWGSHYGYGLDVVAPGIYIPTTILDSDYTYEFKGTSAACPHAAGVMALMLSANPCLTQSEARNILRLSCDKIDQYGFCFDNGNMLWNYEVGYGKINAYKAVLYALSTNQYNMNIGGSLVSTTDNLELVLDDGYCSDISAGWYYCKQYKYSATINFPNMEDPNLIVVANGLSDTLNYNNGNHYTRITSLTNTSAVLTTWRYYLYYNIIGQGMNTYIPSSDNVMFKITIVDVPKKYISITDQNISSGIFNRHALKNLHTNNITVSGSAEVRLIARDSIVMQNGTIITPATGHLIASIEQYNPCLNNTNGDFVDDKQMVHVDIIQNHEILSEHENKVFHADEILYIIPNPNNGSFYVSISNTEEEIIGIRVMDVMGKTVYSDNKFTGGDVVLPNVKQGLYYVTVVLKNGAMTEKIVIK